MNEFLQNLNNCWKAGYDAIHEKHYITFKTNAPNPLGGGMNIEIAYVPSTNTYVKIIPSSGSFYQIISEPEAQRLMKYEKDN